MHILRFLIIIKNSLIHPTVAKCLLVPGIKTLSVGRYTHTVRIH